MTSSCQAHRVMLCFGQNDASGFEIVYEACLHTATFRYICMLEC